MPQVMKAQKLIFVGGFVWHFGPLCTNCILYGFKQKKKEASTLKEFVKGKIDSKKNKWKKDRKKER